MSTTPTPNMTNVPFDYDRYWMAYLKDLLHNTVPKLQKRFQHYITYLDTLSITTFISGTTYVTYIQTDKLIIYLLFIVPIIVLQRVKHKISVDLTDPTYETIKEIRDPKQIHLSHNNIVNKLRERLLKANRSVSRATIIFLVCVPLGIYIHNCSETAETSKVTFDKDNYILVDANLPDKAKDIILEIRGQVIQPKPKKASAMPAVADSTAKPDPPTDSEEIQEIERKTIHVPITAKNNNEISMCYHQKILRIIADTALLHYKVGDERRAYMFVKGEQQKKTANTTQRINTTPIVPTPAQANPGTQKLKPDTINITNPS